MLMINYRPEVAVLKNSRIELIRLVLPSNNNRLSFIRPNLLLLLLLKQAPTYLSLLSYLSLAHTDTRHPR